MLFIMTKHNMWILGVDPFLKLQNNTKELNSENFNEGHVIFERIK